MTLFYIKLHQRADEQMVVSNFKKLQWCIRLWLRREVHRATVVAANIMNTIRLAHLWYPLHHRANKREKDVQMKARSETHHDYHWSILYIPHADRSDSARARPCLAVGKLNLFRFDTTSYGILFGVSNWQVVREDSSPHRIQWRAEYSCQGCWLVVPFLTSSSAGPFPEYSTLLQTTGN